MQSVPAIGNPHRTNKVLHYNWQDVDGRVWTTLFLEGEPGGEKKVEMCCWIERLSGPNDLLITLGDARSSERLQVSE